MKRYVIVWDNDIGWCEKLQREFAKLAVEIVEIDTLRGMTDSKLKQAKKLEEELMCVLSEKKETAVAFVLSVSQMMEWEEYADTGWKKSQMLSKERNSTFFWDKILQGICERSMLPVVLIADENIQGQEFTAFEAGVCDYIEREKEIRICARRILACSKKQRRAGAVVAESEAFFYLDEKKQCIHFEGEEIVLTQKEYLVFSLLWKNVGELVSKEELLDAVWSEKRPKCPRVVDTIVKQLRSKLKETPYVIQTKYKRGYYVQLQMN